jgi:hypothetical protein
MAAIKGRDGQIALGAAASTIAYIDTWSISLSSDKDEITAFGDDWHKYIQTIQGATGSASGTRDTAATGQTTILALFCSGGTVASQNMWLTETTGAVFTCAVLIDSIDIGVPVNGKETFSIGFTVNARPSHS